MGISISSASALRGLWAMRVGVQGWLVALFAVAIMTFSPDAHAVAEGDTYAPTAGTVSLADDVSALLGVKRSSGSDRAGAAEAPAARYGKVARIASKKEARRPELGMSSDSAGGKVVDHQWFRGNKLKAVPVSGVDPEGSVNALAKQAAREAKQAAITQTRLHMKIEEHAANAALTKYPPLYSKLTGKETKLPKEKGKSKGKK